MNKWDNVRNKCSADEEVAPSELAGNGGGVGGSAAKKRAPGAEKPMPMVPGVADPSQHTKKEGFQWVQCDACGKWRKIPASVDASKVSDWGVCCYDLHRLPIASGGSFSCLDALRTRSSKLPMSPSVFLRLPMSITRLSLLPNPHP